MPKFPTDPQPIPPILIDRAIYDKFAAALGEDWAYSYLRGALISNQKLIPRTQTAWLRIGDNSTACDLLRTLRIALVKPPAFEPERRAAA